MLIAFLTTFRASRKEPLAELLERLHASFIASGFEVLAELMAEHVALKKDIGNSDQDLGPARYVGSDRGFRPALVAED